MLQISKQISSQLSKLEKLIRSGAEQPTLLDQLAKAKEVAKGILGKAPEKAKALSPWKKVTSVDDLVKAVPANLLKAKGEFADFLTQNSGKISDVEQFQLASHLKASIKSSFGSELSFSTGDKLQPMLPKYVEGFLKDELDGLLENAKMLSGSVVEDSAADVEYLFKSKLVFAGIVQSGDDKYRALLKSFDISGKELKPLTSHVSTWKTNIEEAYEEIKKLPDGKEIGIKSRYIGSKPGPLPEASKLNVENQAKLDVFIQETREKILENKKKLLEFFSKNVNGDIDELHVTLGSWALVLDAHSEGHQIWNPNLRRLDPKQLDQFVDQKIGRHLGKLREEYERIPNERFPEVLKSDYQIHLASTVKMKGENHYRALFKGYGLSGKDVLSPEGYVSKPKATLKEAFEELRKLPNVGDYIGMEPLYF